MNAIAALGLESVLWCYVCLAMRLGPILATLPPFSFGAVSWMLRGLLLSMVCLSITPLMGQQLPIEIPSSIGVGLGILTSEFLFGAAIALSIHLFLSAFQTIGSSLADLTGISLDDTSDETGVSNQVQRSLAWIAGILFILCGGHRWALKIVFESFDRFPLGSGFDAEELLYQVPLHFGQALSIAVRIALPAAVVIILLGVAKAWIMRALRAWDNYAIGGPVQVVGLIWGLLLSISSMGWLFQHEIAIWMDKTQRTVLEPQQWSSSKDSSTSRSPAVGKDG